jgi:hypothetical protein
MKSSKNFKKILFIGYWIIKLSVTKELNVSGTVNLNLLTENTNGDTKRTADELIKSLHNNLFSRT